ncbi:MAG: hypothetical protein JNL38_06275 [Myxococcales bacterium]|jgi:hypothetical protein|nr:hypothetical protein [Myxococcales bacterium]
MLTASRALVAGAAIALGACSALTSFDGLRGGGAGAGGAPSDSSAVEDVASRVDAGSTNDGGFDAGADGARTDGSTTVDAGPFCDSFPAAIVCSDFETPPVSRGFESLAVTGNGSGTASANEAKSGTMSFRSSLPGGVVLAGAELKHTLATSLASVRVTYDVFVDGPPVGELELTSWQTTGGRQFVITVSAALTRLCTEAPSATRQCVELPAFPRDQWVKIRLTMTNLKSGSPTARLNIDGVDVATRTFDPFTIDFHLVAVGLWNESNGSGTAYLDDVVIDTP